MRIQEFLSGGVGSSRPNGQKTVRTTFYLFICLSTQGVFYNLQKESNDLLWGNLYSSKDQKGVQHYPGGGGGGGSNFYQREIHFLISRNPYNL